MIGVLALQGGYQAHQRMLDVLGLPSREVRSPGDLEGVSGIVLPGGESTTQKLLIDAVGLRAPLEALVKSGTPVLATCAGLILAVDYSWIDVELERNAWGRQVHSFEAVSDAPSQAFGAESINMMFIRAPRITSLNPVVDTLLRLEGEPVLVRQGSVTAACFHPELGGDTRVHEAVFAFSP